MREYTRLSITVELLEDTHIGTGAGGDLSVDAVTQKDRHGYPVIPATHFRGILRDVAAAYGMNTQDLFGKPPADNFETDERAKLTLTPLTLSSEEKKRYPTPSDYFTLWQRTALCIDSKTPEENTLRVFEFVRAGLRFSGEMELPKEYAESVKALEKRIIALGHGRTRGQGRVRVTFTKAKARHSVEWPRDLRVKLLLKNLDGVCLPNRRMQYGGSNYFPTERLVRGQRLKGALVQYVISRLGVKASQPLFAEGFTVSDALPVGDSSQQEAPKLESIQGVMCAPANLQLLKEGGWKSSSPFTPHWMAKRTKRYIDLFCEKERSVKTKRLKSGQILLCKKDRTFLVYTPEITIKMRNQIMAREALPTLYEDEKRKAEQLVSPELYSEERLRRGQLFYCEVCLPQPLPEDLTRLFNDLASGSAWLRIGRGGVPFQVVDTSSEQDQKISVKPGEHTLVFASDTILRDPWHNFLTGLDNETIKTIPELAQVEILDNALMEKKRVTGFNGASRAMKLPKLAIKAGSVLRFKTDSSIEFPLSLGEDQELGYGRIAVLDQLKIDASSVHAPVAKRKNGSDKQLRLMKELGEIFSHGASRSHLQWMRSELHFHLNREEKARDTQATMVFLQDLEKRAQKLAGKELGKIVEGIRNKLENNPITPKELLLGIRMALLNQKGGRD